MTLQTGSYAYKAISHFFLDYFLKIAYHFLVLPLFSRGQVWTDLKIQQPNAKGDTSK